MSAPTNPTITAKETLESLNGFDEIAIEKAFGKEFDDLGGRATVRALIFIQRKRAGDNDKDAKTFALSVPMGQLDDHFAKPAEEVDEDDPETDAGKGNSDDA